MRIITDIDDVWFKWLHGLTGWVKINKNVSPIKENYATYDYILNRNNYYSKDISDGTIHGWVMEYNSSEDSDLVPLYENSKEVLNELSTKHEMVAITCNHERRVRLLNDKFPKVFEKIYVTKTHKEKYDILKKYNKSIWLEDRYENSLMGLDLGHYCVLMSKKHNLKFEDKIKKFENFKKKDNGKFICRVDNYTELLEYINNVK